MTENKSLDIAGIGEAAKAIPPDAWKQAVDTACTTFREAVTALTSGLGRLITAKFDRLVDAEKVLAAQAWMKVAEKVTKSGRKPSGKAKAPVLIAATKAASLETDAVLRELWSNLLAQELLDGSVHPEFGTLLSRLNGEDARILSDVATEEKGKSLSVSIKARVEKEIPPPLMPFEESFEYAVREREEEALSRAREQCFGPTNFSHAHLKRLTLITEVVPNDWYLTVTGRAFIKAVSDPSAE